MLLTFVAQHLLVATWGVGVDSIARALPAGLEPARADDGRGTVSIAAYRATAVKLDGLPGPSFSQVDVRAAVVRDDDPGAFFLTLRVTPGGLGGVFLGAPYRPGWIRVREGFVRARGLGLVSTYRPLGVAEDAPPFSSGPARTRTIGYYAAAGLHRVEAEHGSIGWRQAEIEGESRFEPVVALGFDVGLPESVLYAESTSIRVKLPPEKVE